MPFLRSAAIVLLAASWLARAPAGAAPTTFDPVIGSALLCLDHVENRYFQSWLTSAFGPAYKRGRGIQLMEAHMDEVEIISGTAGTTIHMVKYENPADEKTS